MLCTMKTRDPRWLSKRSSSPLCRCADVHDCATCAASARGARSTSLATTSTPRSTAATRTFTISPFSAALACRASGPRGGSAGDRPVIRLADSAHNVSDGILLYFQLIISADEWPFKGSGPSPPSHYSAMLRNVIVDMGTNPAVSAVSMSGAQLCSIEDVTVGCSARRGTSPLCIRAPARPRMRRRSGPLPLKLKL